MRLQSHKDYMLTEPGQEPRRVTFLAYKGGGMCKIIDFDNPKPRGSVYRNVKRELLSECVKESA